MDFKKYNRAKQAETGSWLHIVHPDTQEALYAYDLLEDAEHGIDAGWNALTEAEFTKALTGANKGSKAKGQPIRVKLMGMQSPVLRKLYKTHERDVTDKRMAMAGLAKRAKQTAQHDLEAASEVFAHDLLIAAVIGWDNIVWGGKLLPYNATNLENIIPDAGELDCPTEWVIDQITDHMQENSNFLPSNAKD